MKYRQRFIPFLLTVILSVPSLDGWAAGEVSWARAFGGVAKDVGTFVATDSIGNIFVGGYFSGTVNFGGGPLTSAGGVDMFLAKYNSAGVHQWSYHFGSTGDESLAALALDSKGNIFVAGNFVGAANFGGATFASAGSYDGFLAKYSSQGQPLWSHSYGGVKSDRVNKIAVDSQGNIVLAATYQGAVSFGGDSFNSTFGGDSLVLAKYSPKGVHLWSKTFASGSANEATGVAVDKNGNIFLTGYFYSWVDFGVGRLTSASAAPTDFFVAKFSSVGSCLWSKRYGDINTERALAIAVDTNGDASVFGTFYKKTDLGGGVISGVATDQDMFLAKYSGQDGSYLWSKPLLGNFGGWAQSVACDAQKNILLTGYFYGNFNFGTQTLTSNANSYDMFVAKYTSSGTQLWAQNFGGTGSDLANAIVIDPSGNPILTGSFSATATFDGQSLTSAGSSDVILLKLNP